MKTQLHKMLMVGILIFSSLLFSQIRKDKLTEVSDTRSQALAAGSWTNNYPKDCFCCDGVYNLPEAPEISGPQSTSCEKPITFTIKPCKGTSIQWSVSPNATFSGQGTNSITINPPYTASSYVVSVTIRCGEKTVTSKRDFSVEKPKNCVPNFLVTVEQLANGQVKINAVPTATSGVEHYWGVVYNGTYPNCVTPCAAIPLNSIQSGSTFGAYVDAAGIFSPLGMGTNITGGTAAPYGYSYSGFPNNSCFKITHYVKCCGEWYRQTQCVSIGTSNAKLANGATVQPQITVGEPERVK